MACESDTDNCGYYDVIDGTCTNVAPSYTDNCDVDFGAFAKACDESSECSWNRSST